MFFGGFSLRSEIQGGFRSNPSEAYVACGSSLVPLEPRARRSVRARGRVVAEIRTIRSRISRRPAHGADNMNDARVCDALVFAPSQARAAPSLWRRDRGTRHIAGAPRLARSVLPLECDSRMGAGQVVNLFRIN